MSDPLLPIWYEALASADGIAISCSDRLILRRRLWTARDKAADRDLADLSIILSPDVEDELWIVKKILVPKKIGQASDEIEL